MPTVACEAPGRIGRLGTSGTDHHVIEAAQPDLCDPRVLGHERAPTAERVPEGGGVSFSDPKLRRREGGLRGSRNARIEDLDVVVAASREDAILDV